jgi:hypothetical protein
MGDWTMMSRWGGEEMSMANLRAWMVSLLLAAVAWGGERTVFQIGTRDGSYGEFAIAGDYPSYAKRFATPPVFEVGESEAGRDWPFIHPGPLDAWAGRRVHPFRIRFPLPEKPTGTFALQVAFNDVHGSHPPRLAVTVGGHRGEVGLKPGGGDASLSDPKQGTAQQVRLALPAWLFRQGMNEVVLACVDGSWVQYDAITLTQDPSAELPAGGIEDVAVRPTPFYIRGDGEVRRAVEVAVSLSGPVKDLSLRVEAAGERVDVPVEPLPLFGGVSREVGVPGGEGPVEVKVTARAGDQQKATTATVPPQRKWRIFVAPSAHTDVGYTDIQPKCAERHCENIDLACELLERFPDFRWNCEVAWQADRYLALREGETLGRFLRLAREGKIGLQALYCNILTGLCHHEELCRLTAFAHRLHREHGFPYRSAMINDVPTLVSAMPTVLAGAGVRYFSEGSNNTRAPTFTRLYAKSPCWWEGPDGSRVLMVFTPSYAYAHRWGLQSNIEQARRRVLDVLRGYEGREDYPYDAVFANGAVSDNCPLQPRLAEVATAWNDRYAFPRIILCHNAEFFQYIEENFGEQLPVVRGSGGTYWEDGAGSSARETALNRRAHETLVSAETLFALVRAMDADTAVPSETLAEAWRNCMLYDEHTWGAHCSITQPESEFTKAQWRIKAQFAHDAAEQSAALLDQALAALVRHVRTRGPALVAVNPLSWPRSDVLEVDLPEGQTLADAAVPVCDAGGTTLVAVEDVPACGYRVLPLKLGGERPAPAPAIGTVIESRFYRVAFDAATGAVTSIRDRELGRELVDGDAPFGFNHVLYAAGGEGSRIVRGHGPEPKLTVSEPKDASLRRLRLAGMGERMIVETRTENLPRIVSEVTVWNDVKRIDIVQRLVKTKTYQKEAVYVAFPFAADKPTVHLEEPCAIINPATDMLPGACLDWFTVQHFVELDAGDAAIAWATPDAPLVCLGDINRGKWQTELPLANGHVFSYAMNSYWYTNYLAGQGGQFTFRYAITSRKAGDRAASARFGWGASSPLLGAVTDANPQGKLQANAAGLLRVDEPNVFLVGAKRAEVGSALVLRLWELTGQATTARLQLPFAAAGKAVSCSLVEEPQKPLSVDDGAVEVPLRAAGLATVRLE